MGFLTFLGIAGAVAYGLKSESANINYKHKKESFLQSVNYNIDVKRDFNRICYVNGVRKKATNTLFGIQCNDNPPIWPKKGYQKCIPFLREQPGITQEDIDLFKRIYDRQREISLEKLQQVYDENYDKMYNHFINQDRNNERELTVFTKKHWEFFDIDTHQKMVDDIYYNTFWNEIATGPAKVIGSQFNKRKEIWQIKNYLSAGTYYLICQNKCGYNDYML
ncbi:MAG: hypothetical protein IKF82_00475 [Bacilli bacterium]|nr:hypothetical protein [Bacilli bacterium]